MIDWVGGSEPGKPYWWEGRPDRPEFRVGPPSSCDILVVGGGYTGLSAAIAAHDGGANVVVIDAGEPGDGASTRNGGMVGAHPRVSWEKLAATFDSSVADGVFAEAGPALRFVSDLIHREKIECDFRQSGRISLAWTPSHFDRQKRLADRVREKSDVEIEVVDRHDLGREIQTDCYFGGILFPEHGGLHPRKFHDGLVDAVTRRGIAVVSNCPVTEVNRPSDKWTAKTPAGEIKADAVILATNGYTTDGLRWLQRRVFPVPSFLVATEPLDSDLIAKLAPGSRMMVETRARHSYFRPSPDGRRIVFGGRASLRDIPVQLAADRLRSTMLQIWPRLAGVRITHAWTGNTGYCFNHLPHIGGKNGLFWSVGYSGSGTVMAPYLGTQVAWLAMGDPRAETAYQRTTLRTNWIHPFRKPHFLKAADVWYRAWVDTREDRQSRT